ncbi:hypothetical protein [Kitasatospora sp. DSM 101779]|uniref:hypothetical protein n=1 Tax=Kitasatospora sp. DSM 101779 TaxID=2853165 RepID=UPI0021D9E8E9|nr:hypothetical protein [Kitasatospora sp. DSM 101779]MCU7826290.1 hypothetical protein [Kitasatospora sp. DSM 101779]
MNPTVPHHLSVAELAAEAAELLRVAADASHRGGGPGLLHTTEAAEAVGALAGLTARLPELLDRLEAFLSSEQAAGRIAPDPAGADAYDAIRTARDAREQLYEAGRTAALLADCMAAAAGTLAPLGAPRTAGGPTVPHA